jgi:hypothetical protein
MKGWKKLLGQLAPTVATALGGPMAGAATKYISQALLGHKDGSESDIEAALLNATPQEMAKFKEIENNFKADMKRAWQ